MARSENPTPDGTYPGTMAMSAEDIAAFDDIIACPGCLPTA
jgi:hypothetical protein